MFEIEIINEEGESKCITFAPEEIDTICRSCLSKNGLFNLFEINYKGTLFSEIFNTFFAQLNPSDNLPKKICDVCALSFMQFCALKEQILQSQNLLQMTLGEIKQEVITEEEIQEDILDNCEHGIPDNEYKDEENQIPGIKVKSKEADFYRIQNVDNGGIKEEATVSDRDKRTELLEGNFFDENEMIKLPKSKQEMHTCSYCEEQFYSYHEYKKHRNKEVVMRRPKAICPICSKAVLRHRLKDHMILHSEKKPFSCDICGMRFSRRENISRHKYTHRTTKPHMCHICGKGFIQAPSLTDHLRTHYDLEPFISQFCGRKFTTKQALEAHLKLHTKKPDLNCKERNFREKNERYTCEYCQKQWTSKQCLDIHIRSHTGERPFVCNVCGKRFIQHQHLTGHLLVHNGEKPHSCSYCGKSFALKGNLNQHIKIHTGDRPYVCNVCLKGFCTRSSLKKHKRIHSRTE